MIGGSEMQMLYQQLEVLQEELEYLKSCKKATTSVDYHNSAERFEEDITTLNEDMIKIREEIENYEF